MSNRLHLVLSYKMRGTLPAKTSVTLFAIHVLCSCESRIRVNSRLFLLVTTSVTIGNLERRGEAFVFCSVCILSIRICSRLVSLSQTNDL